MLDMKRFITLQLVCYTFMTLTDMKVYLRLNLVGQRCRGGELMRHKNEEMERAMGGVRECRECRERHRVEGEGERGRGKTSQGQRER